MKISEIIEKNKKSIILIALYIPEKEDKNKGKLSVRGTGFIVSSEGEFLTCGHVYKQIAENDLPYLEASVPDKTDEKGITHYNRYKVKLLKMDEENDLALMKIVSEKKKNDFPTVSEFGDAELVQEGDEAVFMGYPLATELLRMKFGITISTSHCIISSIKKRGADGSLHFFMIDAHINNGSSGSPVFLQDTGKIIGIASARISSKVSLPDGKVIDVPANMGICRPIKYAFHLIKK